MKYLKVVLSIVMILMLVGCDKMTTTSTTSTTTSITTTSSTTTESLVRDVSFTLMYEDETLEWNDIEDAIGYNVFVNDVLYESAINAFTLSDLEPGVKVMSVQAVFADGVSNRSDALYVEYQLIDTDHMYFQYSIHSSMDIIIWDEISNDDLYVQNSDAEFIEKDLLLNLDSEHLEIKSSHLIDFGVGTYQFYLIHGIYKTLVEINVTDGINPYIISSSTINTTGESDVYLQYELFDGTFYSVNGSREDDVLYHTEDNILIIEEEFISQKFIDNNSFVLSYVINKDENSVIGYLFFNLLED